MRYGGPPRACARRRRVSPVAATPAPGGASRRDVPRRGTPRSYIATVVAASDRRAADEPGTGSSASRTIRVVIAEASPCRAPGSDAVGWPAPRAGAGPRATRACRPHPDPEPRLPAGAITSRSMLRTARPRSFSPRRRGPSRPRHGPRARRRARAPRPRRRSLRPGTGDQVHHQIERQAVAPRRELGEHGPAGRGRSHHVHHVGTRGASAQELVLDVGGAEILAGVVDPGVVRVPDRRYGRRDERPTTSTPRVRRAESKPRQNRIDVVGDGHRQWRVGLGLGSRR